MATAFDTERAQAQLPQDLAALRRLGVTRGMTRGPGWRRTSRGLFVSAREGRLTTTQRILDAVPLVPPSGALAGWAAAYVLGVDLLDGLDPWSMAPQAVPIALGKDLGRRSIETVRYVRDRLPAEHRQIRAGLSVTTPLRTAFDGARWAPNLVEAVVFLDQVAHALETDLVELSIWSQARDYWPGIRQLRRALFLTDPDSASPWESRLRMFYVLEAGLPSPLVNRPIFTLTGRLLGIADLFDEDAGLVTEFDGRDHRGRRQHRADNLREEELEGVNLTVCRVDSLDFRFRRPLTERLRARHAQGLRRDRSFDEWTLDRPSWWRRPTAR